MKNTVFPGRTGVRGKLLATTMLTVIGAGASLLGPRAFAQTADQPANNSTTNHLPSGLSSESFTMTSEDSECRLRDNI